MAQQKVDTKVGEAGLGNDEAVLCAQDTQLPVLVKKTPLRDLQSRNNIVVQKGPDNPLVLKETVITGPAKVSGSKRPSPDVQMNAYQQSPNNSGANGRLVYVRRKSEGETGKTGNNEVISDNTQITLSPQQSQVGHQDGVQLKSSDKDLSTQCLSENAPIPASPAVCIPSTRPSIPPVLGSLDSKSVCEEHQTQKVPSPISLPAEARVDNQNWEERYIQLQMYLKKLDQSSLEDHLQRLRSLSAVELSRHAIELEKRAIQLSLEQGKELKRVKALNVLGKSLSTSSGPAAAAQQTPQS